MAGMNQGFAKYLQSRKGKGKQVGAAKRFVNKSNYGGVRQEAGEGTQKEEAADMQGK